MWQQALHDVSAYLWIGYILCFLIWLLKDRTINSFFVSLLVFVLFNGLMLYITPKLYHTSDNMDLNRFFWYFTFALIDMVAMFTVLISHKMFKIKLDDSAMSLILYFSVMILVQFVRYTDRQVIGSDVLGEAYKLGIPLLNIITLLYLGYKVTIQGDKKDVVSC